IFSTTYNKIVILCKQNQILCGTTQICSSSMAHSVGVNTADCIKALPSVKKALSPNSITPTPNAAAGIKDIANSQHCDKPGYPSCDSVGQAAGQNAGNIPCPSGHTKKFCGGWNKTACDSDGCGGDHTCDNPHQPKGATGCPN